MQEIPIVLIGHKDHGKSTLIGRLLLDTRSIKESKLKKVREVDEASGREFEFAHFIDSFKEERVRGMTMDTTSILLKGEKRNYQLIDVPGHRMLISQMLTGTSRAEVAILVVSIREGIGEQTIQHLKIAKLLGISQLGVVINKMDKVKYQQEAFEKLVKKLKGVLKKIGCLGESIYFFPISALKGDNVTKKSSQTPWYPGPTLMDFLENEIKKPESFETLSLRFLVQDTYSIEGEKILVGKVESGRLKVGQNILFLPESKRDKIQSIKDFKKELNFASAGKNIGITLKERSDINRGAVGCLPDYPPQMGNILSGEIFWLKKPTQRELFCECGTNRVKGELLEPKKIYQRKKSFYKISLENPIAFDPKSKTILGKIVLKEKGEIIGVGNIE